jgi:hypothetical protein
MDVLGCWKNCRSGEIAVFIASAVNPELKVCCWNDAARLFIVAGLGIEGNWAL